MRRNGGEQHYIGNGDIFSDSISVLFGATVQRYCIRIAVTGIAHLRVACIQRVRGNIMCNRRALELALLTSWEHA